MSRILTVPEEAAGARQRRGPARIWRSSRVGGGLVLAAWAVAFWFLLATGRYSLYLSTRTSWVVPVGAGLLTVAALGRMASARGRAEEPLARREAWVMGLMVLPVVVVLVLPPTTLGSFAVPKRTSFSGASFNAAAGDISSGPLTLLDVATAQASKEGERALAKRAGSQVDFIGFVIRYGDTPADELLLTRYIITCCVADATIAQVRVVNVPPGKFAQNDWVEVRGRMYPLGREVIVDASAIVDIPTPAKPYITP